MLIHLFINEVGQEFHLHVKHLPRSPSQFSKSVFISPSRSWVCYICVSDVRQTLEAPQKEKHKKNKEKHKTKKEHRRRKEKVSTFWGPGTGCRLCCACFCPGDKLRPAPPSGLHISWPDGGRQTSAHLGRNVMLRFSRALFFF